MYKNNKWISLPVFLSLGLLRTLAEKPMFGNGRILLAATLGFSKILYEAGAILALVLKDRLPLAFPMFGYEGTIEEFRRNFSNNVKRRLEIYGKKPNSFSCFVGETDVNIYGISVRGILDKKIPVRDALELLVSSWCEGVIFGGQFPELTQQIMVEECEWDKKVSWDNRALMNQLTLLGDLRNSVPTVAEKEDEMSQLTRSYAEKYFPDLINDLGLTRS